MEIEEVQSIFLNMLNENSYLEGGIKSFQFQDSAKIEDSELFSNVYVGIGYFFTPKIIYVRALFDSSGKLLADELAKSYNDKDNTLIDVFEDNIYKN